MKQIINKAYSDLKQGVAEIYKDGEVRINHPSNHKYIMTVEFPREDQQYSVVREYCAEPEAKHSQTEYYNGVKHGILIIWKDNGRIRYRTKYHEGKEMMSRNDKYSYNYQKASLVFDLDDPNDLLTYNWLKEKQKYHEASLNRIIKDILFNRAMND